MAKAIKMVAALGVVSACVALVAGGSSIAFGVAAGICVWYLRMMLAMRDAEATLRTGQQLMWVRSYFSRWAILVAAAFLCGFVGGVWAALGCLIAVLVANWLFAVASYYEERQENA